MNISSAVRIKIRPNLDKVFKLLVSYAAAILALNVVEALKCYSDEKVYQD